MGEGTMLYSDGGLTVLVSVAQQPTFLPIACIHHLTQGY